MESQGLLGQLNQSMSQGVPALGQVSSTSPNADPSLQVQPPMAMPQKSPATMMHLHSAAARRGIDHTQIPQLNLDASGQVTLPIQDANSQEAGVQIPVSEEELLIKAINTSNQALHKRLDHHSKMTDKLVTSFLPPQDQGVT